MKTVTPSKSSTWLGGMEDHYTQTALAAIRRLSGDEVKDRIAKGLTPHYKHPVTMIDRRSGIPYAAMVKVAVITCDKLAKRLLVIAPDGTRVWVDWRK